MSRARYFKSHNGTIEEKAGPAAHRFGRWRVPSRSSVEERRLSAASSPPQNYGLQPPDFPPALKRVFQSNPERGPERAALPRSHKRHCAGTDYEIRGNVEERRFSAALSPPKLWTSGGRAALQGRVSNPESFVIPSEVEEPASTFPRRNFPHRPDPFPQSRRHGSLLGVSPAHLIMPAAEENPLKSVILTWEGHGFSHASAGVIPSPPAASTRPPDTSHTCAECCPE